MPQTVRYLVPEGVTIAEYEMQGGRGGSAADGTPGSEGEWIRAQKSVKPGEILTFTLGDPGKGVDGGEDGEPGSVRVWWITEAEPVGQARRLLSLLKR